MDPITSFNFVPGVNLDATTFTPAQIAAAEAVVQQMIQDLNPGINISRNSTLFDAIARQQAILYILNKAMNQGLQDTMSIQGIINNPSVANDEVLNEILSNVLVQRDAGAAATGLVRVNCSQNTTYLIGTTVVFTTVDGLKFSPTANFQAVSSPSNSNQLQLYPGNSASTQWYFLVPVVASAVGVASQLIDGTSLSMTPVLPFFISTSAFGNFQGGTDAETNEALVARIPAAQAAKNMVSRTSITGTIQEQFPQVLKVAVQGMNDPTMTRNIDILNFRKGGYVDVYVRSSLGMAYTTIQKIATLIGLDINNNALYSVILSSTDLPGYYYVTQIVPAGSSALGTYQVLSEAKGFNAQVYDSSTGMVLTPNRITTQQEAAYSSYQTAEVQFQIDYDVALGTPADQFAETLQVSLTAAMMPNIADIQAFVLNPLTGIVLTADYLVRAVVPCLVEISPMVIRATPMVNASVIQQAIFNYVNKLAPGDPLRVDTIVALILAIPGVPGVDLPIRLTGMIYAPGGNVIKIVSDSSLAIPSRPALQVVPDNTAFFLELQDIPIEIITS